MSVSITAAKTSSIWVVIGAVGIAVMICVSGSVTVHLMQFDLVGGVSSAEEKAKTENG